MSESSSSVRSVELAWLEKADGERRYVESEYAWERVEEKIEDLLARTG